MKINNKKYFATGLVMVALGLCVLFIGIKDEANLRKIICSMACFAVGIITVYASLSNKKSAKELLNEVDERDQYITMKTGKAVTNIFNAILYIAFLVATILYGIFKTTELLVVIATLGGVLILLFVLVLRVNIYFDKHC